MESLEPNRSLFPLSRMKFLNPTALTAALGAAPGKDADAVLIEAFKATQSPTVFEQIIRRPETSQALLEALRSGAIATKEVGPGNLARLRTHPNRAVANAAANVLEKLSPEAGQKDELIAKLMPEVTKAGNVANGRMVFTAACAICHKYGDIGLRDVGPPLAGIGSKSTLELLTHIVDPNRQVEPNYWQWNLTTRKGETLVGVIVNENANTVTIRNQGGDTEVRREDITGRENTRRSLMPEGLEGLGADGLRDVIAFLASTSTPASAGSAPAPAKKAGKGKAAAKTTGTPQPAAAAVAGKTATEGPKEGGKNDRPLPPVEKVQWETGKTRVLIIGGGSSHKFTEFFGVTDSATLRAAGFTVHYTEDRDQAAAVLQAAIQPTAVGPLQIFQPAPGRFDPGQQPGWFALLGVQEPTGGHRREADGVERRHDDRRADADGDRRRRTDRQATGSSGSGSQGFCR